ncbi:MAG TPA: response regulator [Patescibacteria group bacterium]|jgi:CheY-like chemotaxis protein|nr:response regulator [Patescibacteria group bacterium]
MTKKSRSILVVEDDTALNDAYMMILQGAGYDVKNAFNGKEALDYMNSDHAVPDIILLDLRMPVLDGIGFLKAYDVKKHPDTTVVVFSNFDSKTEIDQAYSLGADRYILKARATPKELLRLVESI